MTTSTRTYAAYDDFSIYGIGSTVDAALADAEQYGATNLRTAPMSKHMARVVSIYGFDGKTDGFGLVNGTIVSGRALDRIHSSHE
jgi:hypothetical protein